MRIPSVWVGTALDGFRGCVRWRRGFHAPRSLSPDERLWVVFDGVDYFADVALNGVPLGRHEGYFEPFEFEVTSLVRPHNELVVDVDCPIERFSHPHGLMRGLRDARRTLRVDGIWRDVALEVRSVAFLSDVAVRTEATDSRGFIRVSGRVVRHTDAPVTIDLSVDAECRATHEVPAAAGLAEFAMETVVEQPKLWWPRNLGEPHTFRVALELHGRARTLDSRHVAVGFRHVELDLPNGSAAINGRRLPASLIGLGQFVAPGQFDLADPVRRDALLARVAGDSKSLVLVDTEHEVLAPAFYDEADASGLLVWQTSPAGFGFWGDPERRAEARRQSDAMVRLLGQHPSVVIPTMA
jgi:beta-mannosidase